MKTTNTRWLALAGFAFVAVTFVAWKNSDPMHSVYQYSPGYEQHTDTAPARKKSYSYKKEIDTKDLDDAMKELDRAMTGLDKNLRIDLSKMNKEIQSALNEVKKIDMGKISEEVRASLKEVDWIDTREEVKRALREAEKEIGKIDKEKIRAEINEATANTFNDVIKNSVALGLQGARIGLDKAKKELMLLKEFTNELKKDGLINAKEGYKIEIKDHEMIINGKKQSKDINDKYRKYFKDGEYTFKSDGEDDE